MQAQEMLLYGFEFISHNCPECKYSKCHTVFAILDWTDWTRPDWTSSVWSSLVQSRDQSGPVHGAWTDWTGLQSDCSLD